MIKNRSEKQKLVLDDTWPLPVSEKCVKRIQQELERFVVSEI